MYGHDGWDWLWMTVGMTAWVVVLAIIVYVAVRHAARDTRKGGP